jgi:non-specific serine/threonine protein kinase
MAESQGDYEEAERLFRESDALFRALGDAPGSAYMQTNLALMLVARGQYAAVEPVLMECVKVARALGDDHLVAVNLGALAIALFELGDADRATSLFEESLTLARSVGDGFLTSEVLSARGRAECRDGNLESAEASLVESLAIAGDLTDPHIAAGTLEGFAGLAVAMHDPKRAATILGAAARLREEIGLGLSVREEREHKRVAAAARAALGDDAFDQAWRGGGDMSLDDAVRYALSDQDAVDNATERPLSATS